MQRRCIKTFYIWIHKQCRSVGTFWSVDCLVSCSCCFSCNGFTIPSQSSRYAFIMSNVRADSIVCMSTTKSDGHDVHPGLYGSLLWIFHTILYSLNIAQHRAFPIRLVNESLSDWQRGEPSRHSRDLLPETTEDRSRESNSQAKAGSLARTSLCQLCELRGECLTK